MSRRSKATYEFAPDIAPKIVDGALDELTRIRLWQNPCWLSARINILGNRYNVPAYGWIEERFGLSRPEFVVLYTLGLSDGHTATQIGNSTGFPKNTLSRAVARLLKLKMVMRQDHPKDGRSFRLSLTARGRGVVDEAMPRLHAREKEMLECLSPRERETLSQLLAKMVIDLERRDLSTI